jgi:hypothetical protein
MEVTLTNHCCDAVSSVAIGNLSRGPEKSMLETDVAI